jgi:hypothetical protein
MAALCRRAAIRACARTSSVPWAMDARPIRGHCLGRVKRRPCGSRWGIVRVSLDFRDSREVSRFAVVECASCGRVWRAIRPPRLHARGLQRVRLTLILPPADPARRWYARGRWHAEGSDAEVLADATLADVDEATRAWRERADKATRTRLRAREKRDAAEVEAVAKSRALMARLAERDEREAEERRLEREAAEREARGG